MSGKVALLALAIFLGATGLASARSAIVLPSRDPGYDSYVEPVMAGDEAITLLGTDERPHLVAVDATGRRRTLRAFDAVLAAYAEGARKRGGGDGGAELRVGLAASSRLVVLAVGIEEDFQDVGPDPTIDIVHSAVLAAPSDGGRARIVQRCGLTQFLPEVAASDQLVATFGGCRTKTTIRDATGRRLPDGPGNGVTLAGRFVLASATTDLLGRATGPIEVRDGRTGKVDHELAPDAGVAPGPNGVRGPTPIAGLDALPRGDYAVDSSRLVDPVTGSAVTFTLPGGREIRAFDGDVVIYTNRSCPAERTTLWRQTLTELAADGPVAYHQCLVALPTTTLASADGSLRVPLNCPEGCDGVVYVEDGGGVALADGIGFQRPPEDGPLCLKTTADTQRRLAAGEQPAAIVRTLIHQPDGSSLEQRFAVTLKNTGTRPCRR